MLVGRRLTNFPIDLWIFLSKIIPSKILFVLRYLLQTVEDLPINYILKAMIMRMCVPPFAGHLQHIFMVRFGEFSPT